VLPFFPSLSSFRARFSLEICAEGRGIRHPPHAASVYIHWRMKENHSAGKFLNQINLFEVFNSIFFHPRLSFVIPIILFSYYMNSASASSSLPRFIIAIVLLPQQIQIILSPLEGSFLPLRTSGARLITIQRG
jgi:hypothetical protein